jgi:hypothetical protein
MSYVKGHKVTPEIIKKISQSQKIRLAKRYNRTVEELDRIGICKNCDEIFHYRDKKQRVFCCRECCDDLGARTGQTNSEEHRRKQALKKYGSQNPSWRGGITKLRNRGATQLLHKRWREQIFKRDNYTCIKCKARNGNGKRITLNADHIKPYAYFPGLRWKISNGQTLCHPCHIEKTRWEGKRYWKNQYAKSAYQP